MSHQSPLRHDYDLRDPDWTAIHQRLDTLHRRSEAQGSIDEFSIGLLQAIVEVAGAECAAIWTLDRTSGLTRRRQAGQLPDDASWATESWRHECTASAAESWQASPGLAREGVAVERHEGEYFVLLVPLRRGDDLTGIIEVVVHRALDEERLNLKRVLSAFSELTTDFMDHLEARQFRNRSAAFQRSSQLLQSIYGAEGSDGVAFAIANDGRTWMQCDRLSVLRLKGRRCVTLAVSGVDLVDRRSSLVCAMEDLATYSAMSDEEIVLTGDSSHMPQELGDIADQYVNESTAKQIVFAPLRMPATENFVESGTTVGVLVAERFTNQMDVESLRLRPEEMGPHFALALGRAVQHDDAPLANVSKSLAKWRRSSLFGRATSMGIAAIIISSAMALTFLQADFRVAATGKLQPLVNRDIFAVEDGIVQKIHVQQGDSVTVGQVLIEMSQSELDYAIGQLDGRIRTDQRRRDSLVALRLDARTSSASADDPDRLAAEQELLEQTIAGSMQERQILQQRRESLMLRTPIAGQVVTWDIERRLRKRPVRRGQRLLTVANPKGPWAAELRVNDRDIRHVVKAQGDSSRPLSVSVLLATDPVNSITGEVTDISRIVRNDQNPTVDVTAVIHDDMATQRPGSTIVARISCGRRSLGFIWFHDVWEWFRTTFWW